MQLLLIISFILIFAVLDAFIYSHLKSRTEIALDRLDRDKKNLQEQVAKLDQQVQELKATEQRLDQERLDLEEGRTEHESEDQKTTQKPEELLLFDKIVSPSQLARAKKYIQENASRLSVLEALLLLNIIDAETASSVRSRIRAERES